MKRLPWRRAALAILLLLPLAVGLPIVGCDEDKKIPTDPTPQLLQERLQAEEKARQELQVRQDQMAERNYTLTLTVGVLSVLVLLAIFIGAGWGSAARKERELRNGKNP